MCSRRSSVAELKATMVVEPLMFMVKEIQDQNKVMEGMVQQQHEILSNVSCRRYHKRSLTSRQLRNCFL